ncbi:MAG: hypothetical protein KDA84_12870, partial [Planctomycetaceae bacterium]|nr:hypothetical protein [Planctomycetaceae bacterium]
MYWVFADSHHLTEVIASQSLPIEVVNSSVHFAESTDGEIWVKPLASIPRKVARTLKESHVRTKQQLPVFNWTKVFRAFARPSWWQILPPSPLSKNHPIDPGESVLLTLPTGEDLTRTLREILRLGGRLEKMYLPADGKGKAILQLKQLPYFTLLATRDRLYGKRQRLYQFHNPQVAIEVGFSHPLVDKILIPENRLLLLDGTGETTVLNQLQFHEIAERRSLSIPTDEPAPFVRSQVDPIPIRFRLVDRPSQAPPCLWVIPLMELQAWVREANQHVLEELSVTISDSFHSPLVILQPLKEQIPPALLWESAAFCLSQTVPGLYLPRNRDLHPQVRPVVIQAILKCHRDLVTWVAEDTGNSFSVCSVARSAFRPLVDWIQYQLPQLVDQLKPWSPQTVWDFERFHILEEPRESREKRSR